MSPNAFRRRAVVLSCACALALTAVPAAQAEPVHEVAPGESLWQIAAVNGLSPAAVAAANGIAPDTAVQAGQTLRIPAAGAPGAGVPAATPAAASPAAGPAVAASSATGPSAGGIVVQPGDTLSSIAARAGVSVTALAAHNGLTASALLPAGRSLSLPARGTGVGAATTSAASGTAGTSAASSTTTTSASTGATASTTSTTNSGTTTSTTASTAAPAGTRVSAGDIGATAAQNGVPSALARAIAWQESGFDNGAVSSVGARGVMQVMPGTWSWIDRNLASRPLDPTSAADNVQAGTLYLRHLLQETGGDEDLAAAGYYQGLSSVRSRGMYDDTKQYVENVRALRSRFGG